jgi:hypothetical protein
MAQALIETVAFAIYGLYASATVRAAVYPASLELRQLQRHGVRQFFSCENKTAIQNTCYSPTPGSLVLQTQFWETYTGLEYDGQLLHKNSWTIHGLWPDNCDE